MVVDVLGLGPDTGTKEAAVVRWIFKNPIAAARLILQLMPEGTWDEEEGAGDDGDWWG